MKNEELMKFRIENCLTQAQLGFHIGATQSQISKWENSVIKMTAVRERQITQWIEKNTAKSGTVINQEIEHI